MRPATSQATATAASISTRGERFAPVAIAFIFFVVGLIGVYHHEMWRDEIEIWMLATDSPTLRDLITNIATQPHPPLWYVMTWVLARLTRSLHAMQLLSLAIGTATAYLFSSRAPLPLLHRALFCFGYFPLFEYTLISRSYGLDLFFVVLFCVLYARDPRRIPRLALTLALLANVHLLGTVIAGVLWLLLVWDAIAPARRGQAGWKVWSSLGVALAGIGFALADGLLATARMGAEHVHRAPIDADWLEGTLSSIVNAYLPFPDIAQRDFWNSSFLLWLPDALAVPVTIGLALLLFAMSVAALRRSGLLLALYVAGTLAMLVVFAEKSSSYMRHYGHLTILITALLWLAAVRGARRFALQGPALAVLAAVLVIHLGAAAFAYGADFVHPFSRSADAARFLAGDPELRDATLVGSIDYTSQPFAAYLGKPIYYPDQQRFGTFMTWGPEREVVRYQHVVRDAARLHRENGKPVVLILDYDPQIGGDGNRCRVDDELELEQLASFPCAIVREESYWLAAMRPYDTARGAPTKVCASRRAWPIGPNVAIPRIQAATAARLARRQARRGAAASNVATPAAAGVGDPGLRAPVTTDAGATAEGSAVGAKRRPRRKLAREERKAVRAAPAPNAPAGHWRLAACPDEAL